MLQARVGLCIDLMCFATFLCVLAAMHVPLVWQRSCFVWARETTASPGSTRVLGCYFFVFMEAFCGSYDCDLEVSFFLFPVLWTNLR